MLVRFQQGTPYGKMKKAYAVRKPFSFLPVLGCGTFFRQYRVVGLHKMALEILNGCCVFCAPEPNWRFHEFRTIADEHP
jgi:hypothetical protein